MRIARFFYVKKKVFAIMANGACFPAPRVPRAPAVTGPALRHRAKPKAETRAPTPASRLRHSLFNSGIMPISAKKLKPAQGFMSCADDISSLCCADGRGETR